MAGRVSFLVKGIRFVLTAHAIEQSEDRTGVRCDKLIRIIKKAFATKTFYVPSGNARHFRGVEEFWIAYDGPRGKGSIVVSRGNQRRADDNFDWIVITVRDASGFTQAERKENLTYSPFAILKETRRGG